MTEFEAHRSEARISEFLDAAEPVTDPIERLVEQARKDPGAALTPEAIEQLSALKGNDLAAFERVRTALREAGLRVGPIDHAIAQMMGTDQRGPTHADMLIECAESALLFHAQGGEAYADVDVDGHRQTHPIRSRAFRDWLCFRFFGATGGAPGTEAINAALNTLCARARFDGPSFGVCVRTGAYEGRIYLDLGDPEWRAVEIDGAGWRMVDAPPLRFVRSAGLEPLPVPVPGGSVDGLRAFLNTRSETDFVLAVFWLLASLRPQGPYPVLSVSGQQGSAKSTFSEVLARLSDPRQPLLRTLPREERDLFIAARNGHVLGFDNVSGLSPWLSDALCRLSTGGGFATRQLHSDREEAIFGAMRPVLINGIIDPVTRPDLSDRSIHLSLDRMPDEKRRTEAAYWEAFEEAAPAIFGALLDGMAEGVRRLSRVRLEALPRMADFALWASACETAFWPEGTFEKAFAENREQSIDAVIERDAVAQAVRDFMQGVAVWQGTATQLLMALEGATGDRVTKSRDWPKSPSAFSARLARAETFLSAVGVAIERSQVGKAKTRTITIRSETTGSATEAEPETASAPSAASGNWAGARLNGRMADGADAADGDIQI